VSNTFLGQHFLAIVLVFQASIYITFFLGFTLAREILGIVYLTFIPGFVFVKILRLDLDTLQEVLFSVGFSVAFLMFAGLVINQFGFIFGLTFPLAALPLSLFVNSIVLVGAAIVYLRQGKRKNVALKTAAFNRAYVILSLLPALSIIGTFLVNTSGDNSVLLIMLLSVVAVFVVGTFSERSKGVYPFAIFMIALSLLFQVTLISNYILPYGGDSPGEFFVFRNTQLNSYWNPILPFVFDQTVGRYDAMLSVTMLPTVYSNILGMDATWVFKVIFPIIFAFVPVALYSLWQAYIGKKLAFFAAFLFMAEATFFTAMTALNRQMIGELFFVLLLLVLLNKKLKTETKFLSFGILSFSLIVSHYALAEIFLFLIFAAWAVSAFYIKKTSFNLQLTVVIFFFVAMFAWYIYTSGAIVFDSFVSFGNSILSQLSGFFSPESRGTQVLTGLGLTESPSILNTISRVFAYITELFVVIGIVAVIFKKTKLKIDRDFVVFGIVAFALLIALIAVPGLANALNMTRFYHILLMLLAPFCIIGIWASTRYISKHENTILISALVVVVLVPYFLFQTSFAYEIAGTDSWSISLSEYRMSPLRLYGDYGYIDSFSVQGAEWVSGNVPYKNYNLHGDNAIYSALAAYGVIYHEYVKPITNSTYILPGEYIYLSYLSIEYQHLMENSSVPKIVNQTSVIYSNGGCSVFYNPVFVTATANISVSNSTSGAKK
jgi:uncharacterized membrane protein